MLKNFFGMAIVALAMFSLVALESNPAAAQAPKKTTFTETVTVAMKTLTVYDIEVRSDQPFSLRLSSPKSASVLQRGSAVSGAIVTPGSPTVYVAKISKSLVDDGVPAGDWTLEVIWDLTKLPSSYTYSVKTSYTK